MGKKKLKRDLEGPRVFYNLELMKMRKFQKGYWEVAITEVRKQTNPSSIVHINVKHIF